MQYLASIGNCNCLSPRLNKLYILKVNLQWTQMH